MSVMEFQVTTDLTPVANTQIETNFEAVKAWLTEELAPYASMVVTPDTVADAKKTRANIRKVKDSIDSQRKAIKKLWNKPYEEYETKCKELTGIVDNAVANIDGQIKEMEYAEKEAKRKRLESFFNINTDDIGEYLTFSDVFDPKWLNATFDENEAATILMEKIEETREALEAIRTMNSPYEAAMLREYSKSHNLAYALGEGKHLENLQRAEEERRRREEEAKAQTPVEPETPPESATEATAPIQMPVQQFVRPMVDDDPPKPKMYRLRFEVDLTREQAHALKDFLTEYGIKYRKI